MLSRVKMMCTVGHVSRSVFRKRIRGIWKLRSTNAKSVKAGLWLSRVCRLSNLTFSIAINSNSCWCFCENSIFMTHMITESTESYFVFTFESRHLPWNHRPVYCKLSMSYSSKCIYLVWNYAIVLHSYVCEVIAFARCRHYYCKWECSLAYPV